MIKLIYKAIKRVIFSFFFLYGYNLLAVSINAIIPLNIITIGTFSLLGIPSLLGLNIIKLLVF